MCHVYKASIGFEATEGTNIPVQDIVLSMSLPEARFYPFISSVRDQQYDQ